MTGQTECILVCALVIQAVSCVDTGEVRVLGGDTQALPWVRGYTNLPLFLRFLAQRGQARSPARQQRMGGCCATP